MALIVFISFFYLPVLICVGSLYALVVVLYLTMIEISILFVFEVISLLVVPLEETRVLESHVGMAVENCGSQYPFF